MDKIMPLLLSAITLMTSCSYKNPAERQDGSCFGVCTAVGPVVESARFWLLSFVEERK